MGQLNESYNIIQDLETMRIEFLDNDQDYFENIFLQRFESALLKNDLDQAANDYGSVSIHNGDYKGFMQLILRKLKSLREQIGKLENFGRKQDLQLICDQFVPELKNRGINPRNLILQTEQSSPQHLQPINTVFPIELSQTQTVESFNKWVRKLHKELSINRNFVEKCTLEEFKDIFTLNKQLQKETGPLKWKTSISRFSLLMQNLSNNNYIGNRFWKQVASCFLFDGVLNSAENLKTYPNKSSKEDQKVINDIINILNS